MLMIDGDEIEAGKAYKNKRVTCPHCNEDFAVVLSWEMTVRKFHENGNQSMTTSRDYWLSTRTEAERKELDAFAEIGMVDTFARVFATVSGSKPKIPEKTFIAWVRSLVPKAMPAATNRFLAFQYPGKSVRVVASLRVAAILVEDVVTEILPTEFIDGDISQSGAGIVRAARPDVSKIENWIKTRFGYVAGVGLLFGEMRKRCIGEFDKPGVTGN